MIGIGQAVAISFAQEGCPKIAIVDRNARGLEETKAAIEKAASGVLVCTLEGDISQEATVHGIIDKAVLELGRIDYAVNAAGFVMQHHRQDSHDLTFSKHPQQQPTIA